MKKIIFPIFLLFLISCKSKIETTLPSVESITESIYASGNLKSQNQYQVVSTVSGTVSHLYVTEGDSVKKGTPLLIISNELQRLNKENAEISASYSDTKANLGKLKEAELLIETSKSKFKNDSIMYFRQKVLTENGAGTALELEQRELAFSNSKNDILTAILKYQNLKRQIEFNSQQSKKNLEISLKQEKDYTLLSEIDGMVYSISISKGEWVGPQTKIAVIGDSKKFILEMQVDEYDILKIKKDMRVLVSLDSYKGKVFEAVVTKIDPLMNVQSKTFLVEAQFQNPPPILFPNTSFEANIVIQSKDKALLIPRNFLVNDTIVLSEKGDSLIVKTGLKDFKKIEILSGIDAKTSLRKP